jgi:hypothetical protein
MKSYSHLEERIETEYDYANNLFSKALPIRAFTNKITSTFLLGVEKIVVISIDSIRNIKTYKRI